MVPSAYTLLPTYGMTHPLALLVFVTMYLLNGIFLPLPCFIPGFLNPSLLINYFHSSYHLLPHYEIYLFILLILCLHSPGTESWTQQAYNKQMFDE